MTGADGRAQAWRRRLVVIAAGLLIGGFIVAYGARPATVLSSAGLDDGLFMRLGRQLAAGRWLGPYDETTLVKGPGFPIFLALVNLSGLPFPLAIAATHAAAAAFAARVSGALTRSAALGLAVLAALLLAPVLYNGELLRVFREMFYASGTLALIAAATALATGCLGRPRAMAMLTGGLGAWVWLTREEGVWLLPCLGLLALVPLLAPPAGQVEATARLRRLAPAGLALGVAVALVAGFGLVNRAVYGRFEVNEIKDRAFQGAVAALQDASAPYHREGIPVPAAARARIYAVSPTFASLKDPILDGPLQPQTLQWGCEEAPKYCGDFGGGWFIWSLRTSAAAKGWHQSPAKAARLYAQLAREVRQACGDGRLQCGHWMLPMVPPIRPSELGDVARSLGETWRVLTFGTLPGVAPRASELSAPDAQDDLRFLNNPAVSDVRTTVTLEGWFLGEGSEWFTPQVDGSAKLLAFSRTESPDLVTHFHDPRLGRQRFSLALECPTAGSCPIYLRLDDGRLASLDASHARTGQRALAGGLLYLDRVNGGDAPLKTRFSAAWTDTASRLTTPFRALVFLGLAAYAMLIVAAAARRRVSRTLLVCTALLASVAARAVLLALVDALSFPAAGVTYALPAIPLLLVSGLLAGREAIALLGARWAARRAAPSGTTAPAPAAAPARAPGAS